MRREVRYTCEICNTSYECEADAITCESQPTLEPPSYLVERVGQLVPAFGENGIRMARLNGFLVRCRNGKHYLYADSEHVDVSHNLRSGEDPLPIGALDPMAGLDFLRYVTPDYKTLSVWYQWCTAYKLNTNLAKAQWVYNLSDSARAWCFAFHWQVGRGV